MGDGGESLGTTRAAHGARHPVDRRGHGLERVARALDRAGYRVGVLSGDVPQKKRESLLKKFQAGQLELLVATDVAARGLDVPTISHVINLGLPMKAEDYVHRIGRTGRAGRTGLAVTLAERRDFGQLQRIQHFTTQRIPASVVPGLEPQRAEPRPAPAHAAPAARKGRPGPAAHRGGPGRPRGHGQAPGAGHGGPRRGPGPQARTGPGPQARAGDRGR